MRMIIRALRRHLKRHRFAREQRSKEAFLFQCAPVWHWSRVRRFNDITHVWERRPER